MYKSQSSLCLVCKTLTLAMFKQIRTTLLQMTAEKAALEREVNALRTDNDRLRANTEAMVAEKWELSAANAGTTRTRRPRTNVIKLFTIIIYQCS
jgi:hypothetical protein